MEEKERFWTELDEVVVICRYGLKERNVEGQMVVDFAKRMEMAVVNTYFKKKEDHRVTYKSGGRCTQVDYVLCRRCNLEEGGSGVVQLQGEEVEKVEEFRYLGSTVQHNGECVREGKKRVQAGWSGWRRVIAGVICDRGVSVRVKGNVYRTVVRPEMLCGLETAALSKRQEVELEVAELKKLRFSFDDDGQD
ncbi:hypothetical protein C0J45_15325 [Silurus meridionalis]|uniref:Uncharacterized protein n=1 Tax=Silurus meridionalis TaxID=175797 RepID=A0A8T0AR96_SILME|nr:hypothetical protein HF521_007357 [Silurus meridionalis]KAI5095250.1 hypothetical protein C0J45_15325 [Silurus meridionalis]